jgi:hypothetical protein
MKSELSETIEITLPKSVCLVLFELLPASYEQWRKVNPNDENAQPLLISAVEHNERVALWKLEGAFETTMPELFSSNYSDLLAESKKLLNEGE